MAVEVREIKKKLKDAHAEIQRLQTANSSLRRHAKQLNAILEQHRSVSAAEIERRDRMVERLKEVLDRMTEHVVSNQKSILTEIPRREEKIGELEFKIAQLNGSLALRIARKIPSGKHIRRLLIRLRV